MKGRMEIGNVREIELTLTLTAPVSEWLELRAQLGTEWPSWEFGRTLSELISKVGEHFDSEFEVE